MMFIFYEHCSFSWEAIIQRLRREYHRSGGRFAREIGEAKKFSIFRYGVLALRVEFFLGSKLVPSSVTGVDDLRSGFAGVFARMGSGVGSRFRGSGYRGLKGGDRS